MSRQPKRLGLAASSANSTEGHHLHHGPGYGSNDKASAPVADAIVSSASRDTSHRADSNRAATPADDNVVVNPYAQGDTDDNAAEERKRAVHLKHMALLASSSSYCPCNPCPHPTFDDDDPVVLIQCRRRTFFRSVLWFFLALVTGGISLLLGKWFELFPVRVMTVPCFPHQATTAICHRASGNVGAESIERNASDGRILVAHRFIRYLYVDGDGNGDDDGVGVGLGNNSSSISGREQGQSAQRRLLVGSVQPAGGAFVRVQGLEHGLKNNQLHSFLYRKSGDYAFTKYFAQGWNDVNIQVPSYLKLLVNEVLSPFIVFQIIAVLLWILEEYYYYSGCIVVVTAISIVITLRKTRQNSEKLANMVKLSAFTSRLRVPASSESVFLNTKFAAEKKAFPHLTRPAFESVNAAALLPGDVFVVEADTEVPCDAAIIQGACLVDESILTGESIPVSKSALPALTTAVQGAKSTKKQGEKAIATGNAHKGSQSHPHSQPETANIAIDDGAADATKGDSASQDDAATSSSDDGSSDSSDGSQSDSDDSSDASTHIAAKGSEEPGGNDVVESGKAAKKAKKSKKGGSGAVATEAMEDYSPALQKNHTIFRGTRVLQCRGVDRVLAVVVRTGFNTAKGQLVRSILYPKPTKFRFYEDGLKFLGALSIIAVFGFIYSIVIFNRNGAETKDMVLKAFDIITIIVPPALPVAMAAGIVYAMSRLQKKKIICISPPRVNVGGKVKVFCFDKTGTLTESSLRFQGVLPAKVPSGRGPSTHPNATTPSTNTTTTTLAVQATKPTTTSTSKASSKSSSSSTIAMSGFRTSVKAPSFAQYTPAATALTDASINSVSLTAACATCHSLSIIMKQVEVPSFSDGSDDSGTNAAENRTSYLHHQQQLDRAEARDPAFAATKNLLHGYQEHTHEGTPTVHANANANANANAFMLPASLGSSSSTSSATSASDAPRDAPLLSADGKPLMSVAENVGDPLEVQLFEATGWKLSEPNQTSHRKLPKHVRKYTVVTPPQYNIVDLCTIRDQGASVPASKHATAPSTPPLVDLGDEHHQQQHVGLDGQIVTDVGRFVTDSLGVGDAAPESSSSSSSRTPTSKSLGPKQKPPGATRTTATSFAASQPTLTSSSRNAGLAVLKCYPFSSQLQRMTVLVGAFGPKEKKAPAKNAADGNAAKKKMVKHNGATVDADMDADVDKNSHARSAEVQVAQSLLLDSIDMVTADRAKNVGSSSNSTLATQAESGIMKKGKKKSAKKKGAGSTSSSDDGRGHVFVYVKGAPEKVLLLCNPASIPSDFHDRLDAYTHDGLRVLAVAGARVMRNSSSAASSHRSSRASSNHASSTPSVVTPAGHNEHTSGVSKSSTPSIVMGVDAPTTTKPLSWSKAKELPREDIERDLVFLGFTLFENHLIPGTKGVIDTLSRAQIRSVMITGDNIRTACSVAKQCNIIPPNCPIAQAHVDVEQHDAGDPDVFVASKGSAPAIATLATATSNGNDGDGYDDDYDDDDDDDGADGGRDADMDEHASLIGSCNSVGSWAQEKKNLMSCSLRLIPWNHKELDPEPSDGSAKSGGNDGDGGQSRHQKPGANRSADSANAYKGRDRSRAAVRVVIEPLGLAFVRFRKLHGAISARVWRPLHSKLTQANSKKKARGALRLPGSRRDVHPGDATGANGAAASRLSPELEALKGKDLASAPRLGIAINGSDLAQLREFNFAEYRRLIVAAAVFARMTPDQKTQVVEDLSEMGYCVGMCGDGANDCGALKAAHVGMSLSEADASVAAPFTSSIQSIACVVDLLKEGRCALVTSFSCFKFMAMYSFIEFISVCILYWYELNLGDWQYLFVDLFIILSIATTMGYTGPNYELTSKRPHGSLMTAYVITSIISQIILQAGFQFASLFLTISRPWFVFNHGKNEIKSYEDTVIFLVSNFQYLWASLAFSVSATYRRPVYTNLWYVGNIIVLCAISVVFLFLQNTPIGRALELEPFPADRSFMLYLSLLIVANAIVSMGFQLYVVNSNWFQEAIRKLRRKKKYKNEYKYIAMEIIRTDWVRSHVCYSADYDTDDDDSGNKDDSAHDGDDGASYGDDGDDEKGASFSGSTELRQPLLPSSDEPDSMV